MYGWEVTEREHGRNEAGNGTVCRHGQTSHSPETEAPEKPHKGKTDFFIALAAGLLLTAVFARQLCPYDPYAQDLLSAQQPPGWQHILGTDRYGRDMFSRVLMGSTTSIFATLVLVAVITVTGTAIGIICGWMGGKVDTVLMRISDLFLAFPSLVFALAVAECWAEACRTRLSRLRQSAGPNLRVWHVA